MFRKEAEEASAKKTSGLLNKAEKAIEEYVTMDKVTYFQV